MAMMSGLGAVQSTPPTSTRWSPDTTDEQLYLHTHTHTHTHAHTHTHTHTTQRERQIRKRGGLAWLVKAPWNEYYSLWMVGLLYQSAVCVRYTARVSL